jgi:hypothetical protein
MKLSKFRTNFISFSSLFGKLVSSTNHKFIGILFYITDSGIFFIVNSSIFGILYFSEYPALSMFFIINIFLYFTLYNWRKLSISLLSYICFSINYMFLLSFLYGFSILYRGLPQARYVEDLSIFSYYRYLTLLQL